MTCDNAFHVRSAKLRHDDKVAGRWPVNGGEPCVFCDLPIGIPCDPTPANDTPDALVELRAAELSHDEPGAFGLIESHGWFDYETDYGPGIDYSEKTFARWSAGWLGRCISQHESNNDEGGAT